MEIQKTTLACLDGIGSVEADENGAFTVHFMNISIKMCKNRILVLASLLKNAASVIVRAEQKQASASSQILESESNPNKRVLN